MPREVEGRPRGTHPVSAFAGALEGGAGARGAASRWHSEPGEMAGGSGRGVLYDGPERRKHQLEWEVWQRTDRRVRPFVYAGDQQV
ncbi:MAG: hypothetical protein Q8P18_28865 [Pseudomonadota bacterium]|nr:hypothetical protein [Pseudomonadota bacterium]